MCVLGAPFAGMFLAVYYEVGVALVGVRLLEAKGHTNVFSLDWSAVGMKLAIFSAADGSGKLWDVGTGRSMFMHRDDVVRFSRASLVDKIEYR